jgi:hypothetical protein
MQMHRLLAVNSDRIARCDPKITRIFRVTSFKNIGPFQAITKRFVMKDADESETPGEDNPVQMRVADNLRAIHDEMIPRIDTQTTLDMGNQGTGGIIEVKGKQVTDASGKPLKFPVTTLLFLKSQIEQYLAGLVEVPTLSPARNWKKDSAGELIIDATSDCYSTDEERSHVNKRSRVKFEKFAGDQYHEPQIDVFDDNVVVADQFMTYRSGELPEEAKNDRIDHAQDLLAAIKVAITAANDHDTAMVFPGQQIVALLDGQYDKVGPPVVST